MDSRDECPKRRNLRSSTSFADGRRPLVTSSSQQRILTPFEGILPDLTKRDEPIFTGLAAVKVTLRPVTSRDKTSSS